MKIDANDLRRHYESMSDEELLAMDPAELTEIARQVYDEEFARRGLGGDAEESDDEAGVAAHVGTEDEEDEDAEADEDIGDGDLDIDEGPPPEWADDAAVACSFSAHRGDNNSKQATRARTVLRAAGIPCCVTLLPGEGGDDDNKTYFYSVMVPGALTFHATAILDRDLFNELQEKDWRTHLEWLSDTELHALKPEIFCAGLLDKVSRLKRVYADELARRDLKK